MNVGELKARVSLDTKGFDSGVKNCMNGFKGLGASVISLNQALELANKGINALRSAAKTFNDQFIRVASTVEKYRLTLDTVLGSQSEGARMFDEMLALAKKLPFEFEAITSSAVALSGVMRGGVDEVVKWMPMISDIAAVSRLSIEDATGQIIRMYSAGASAADLFRERGVLAMLGFQSGVTYSALETRKKLWEMYDSPDSKIKGASEKLVKTWDGMLSNLGDSWFAFRKMVMDGGLFEGLKDKLRFVLDQIDRLEKDGTLARWADHMRNSFISSINAMIKAVGMLIKAIYQIQFAYAALVNTFSKMQNEGIKQTLELGPEKNQGTAGGKVSDLYLDFLSKIGLVDKEKFKAIQKEVEENLKSQIAENEHNITAANEMMQDSMNRIIDIEKATDALLIKLTSGDEKTDATGTKRSAGAEPLSKEAMDALKELEQMVRKTEFAMLASQMNEFQKESAEVGAEMDELYFKYEKVIGESNKFGQLIEKMRKLKAETILLQQSTKLNDAIDEAFFQNSLVGLSESGKEIAKIYADTSKLLEAFPELANQIAMLRDLKIQGMLSQKSNELGEEIKQAMMEGNIIGLTELDQQITQVNFEMNKLIKAFPELADQINKLRGIKLDNLEKAFKNQQLLESIRVMGDLVRGAFQSMEGALTDFFKTWMETGKLAFKELGKALVKELQMYAAQKTAHLLMEAAYHGVMTYIDYNNSGVHSAAAMAALKGAAVMGSFVAGSGLAGMAHDGMSSIPEDGTWLLKKGERVVDTDTNKDLKEYLKNSGGTQVSMEVNINGGDEKGVMKALPALKEAVLDAVNQDISSGGRTFHTIRSYT